MNDEGKARMMVIDESGPAKTVEQAVEAQAQKPKRVEVPPAAQKKALREFKEWKHQLIDMIKRESSISWSVQDSGVVYQFVLPAKLVKLVWNTTIKERVKMEERRQVEGAVERAIKGLQGEVNGAVGQIVDLRREAAQRTLDHLANHPPFAGEQEGHAEASEPPQAEDKAEEQDAPVEEPAVQPV